MVPAWPTASDGVAGSGTRHRRPRRPPYTTRRASRPARRHRTPRAAALRLAALRAAALRLAALRLAALRLAALRLAALRETSGRPSVAYVAWSGRAARR